MGTSSTKSPCVFPHDFATAQALATIGKQVKAKSPFDKEARERARRVGETKRRNLPRCMTLPPTGASIFSIGPEKASTFREKPTVIFIKLWGFRSKLSSFQIPLSAFVFDHLHLFKKSGTGSRLSLNYCTKTLNFVDFFLKSQSRRATKCKKCSADKDDFQEQICYV